MLTYGSKRAYPKKHYLTMYSPPPFPLPSSSPLPLFRLVSGGHPFISGCYVRGGVRGAQEALCQILWHRLRREIRVNFECSHRYCRWWYCCSVFVCVFLAFFSRGEVHVVLMMSADLERGLETINGRAVETKFSVKPSVWSPLRASAVMCSCILSLVYW